MKTSQRRMTLGLAVLLGVLAGLGGSCKKKETARAIVPEITPVQMSEEMDMNQQFKQFLNAYIPDVKKLDKEENLASWLAYTKGGEHYKQMEEATLAKKKYHSDPEKFEFLKGVIDSGAVTDTLLSRQATLIYYDYLENQIPQDLMEKMVKLSSEIEETFNTFRGTVDGKEYTRNDVMDVMKESKDSKMRQKVWEAHKEVGTLVAEKLVDLIKLRNEAARKLGFANYREMQMFLQEYDPGALDAIFKELEEKTQQPFRKYKAELDKLLAAKFKTKPDKLMPWHYADPFFQEAPQFTEVDFDKYYKDKDLVQIAKDFYTSFDLDPAPILERSDLLPREGKSEHAFCFTIDREEPDIRVLANIAPSDRWMDTLLHELGHGFYDSYYTADMPWRLREPAHIFSTEGIAQLFGEMTKNPYWLKEVIGLSDDEVKKIAPPTLKQKALARLIFARWSLVMYYFEKGLYENPDQDLTKLWWDLVEKYQQIKRPAGREKPDWATKDHIVSAPVYYHNYVIGQMFQCQLQEKLAEVAGEKDPLKVIFRGKPDLGRYLIENVFRHGAIFPWPLLVEKSTGKALGVDSYIDSLAWGL
jgi:peptidyl-dipeptidase A